MKNLARLTALILTGIAFSSLAQTLQAAASSGTDRIKYTGSIRQIATTNPQLASGASATLVRSELTQAEVEATRDFSVALKMHDLVGLQGRIGKGEIISLDEMAAKYFPTATEYKTVADWLTSQGFAVKPPDKYNLGVFASGSVAQIERVFAIKFGRVKFAGVEYSSALNAPSLSAAIAGPVLGINGLQPHLHPSRHLDIAPGRAQKLIDNQPPYTIGEIAKAYSAIGLSVNGSGQKIGIVIDTFPAASDLTEFWQDNGIPQSLNNIEEVQVVSGTLPSPSGEETLDAEWSSGTASGAKVRIYATTDLAFVHLDQAYQTIINELPAQPALHQVSLSFGLGETYMPADEMATDDQYFAAMAGAGISVFVSSGDGGSSPGPNGSGDNSGPVQVESPANDPNVTGVGGTSLILNVSTGAVSGESAWYYGGGGISQFFARPSWQNGTGVPSGATRLVPDVSLAADPNTGAFLILNGQLIRVGGTSWAAPTWAGFCAMINQSRANVGLHSAGLLGPKIYPLNGTNSFRDITTGSNGPDGIYNAGPGYDLCTGLGVPRVATLIQAITSGLLPGRPPAVGGPDFNGDGKEDILWRNTLTGDTWIWLMNGNSIEASGRVAIVDLSWTIVGVGDFDGQGVRDIVWYNASIGRVAIWTMNGFAATGSYEFQAPVGAPGEWAVVGIADFDRTGLSDILWQDTHTGALYMWKSVSPLTFATIGIGTVDPSWRVVGAADVEGNGMPDIIWHNSVTGGVYIWQLRNDQVSQEVFMGQYSLSWQIAGFGDFSGDGNRDILWRNNSTGEVCVWLMDGFSVFSQWFPAAPSLAWKVAATPDLNGDGKNDILWMNPSAGLITAWLGTPTFLAQPPPFASVGAGWTVAPSQ
jgi:kumamolisin